MSLDELVAEAVGRALREQLASLPQLTTQVDEDAVLSTREAAQLLHVDEQTVRVEAEAGRLPGRLIGRGWKFSRHALLNWLRCQEPLTPRSIRVTSSFAKTNAAD